MRFIAFALILFFLAGHQVVAQEIGDKVMPTMDAVVTKEGQIVPWPTDMVPFWVNEIGADGSVGNSGYWISRPHVIPLEEAEAYYDEVIENHAFDAKAYRLRGIARREARRWRMAFADFSQAIELAPADADNFCERGIAHESQGEHELALADYDEAIRLDPESTRALMLRGEFWFSIHKNENAIEDFTQVIGINPRVRRVFTRRGCARNRAGEFEKAKSDFEEAIRFEPDDTYGYRMASWFFFSCKDPAFRNGDLAIKYGHRYCELTDWKSAEALDHLAQGYALNGDYVKAIELLNQAIEAGGDPDSFGAIIEQFKKRIYEPGPD